MLGTLRKLLVLILLAPFWQAHAAEEPWYIYFGLGAAKPHYWTELQGRIDDLKFGGGVSSTPMSMSMGFYWALPDPKGMVVGVQWRTYSESVKPNPSVATGMQTLDLKLNDYAVSSMYFFGAESGTGVFLRFDMGLSTLFDTQGSQERPYGGTHFGGGMGYGFALSAETRVLFEITYTNWEFDTKPAFSTNFHAGLFF